MWKKALASTQYENTNHILFSQAAKRTILSNGRSMPPRGSATRSVHPLPGSIVKKTGFDLTSLQWRSPKFGDETLLRQLGQELAVHCVFPEPLGQVPEGQHCNGTAFLVTSRASRHSRLRQPYSQHTVNIQSTYSQHTVNITVNISRFYEKHCLRS